MQPGQVPFNLLVRVVPLNPTSPGVTGSFFKKLWRGSAELVVKMGHRDIPKASPREKNMKQDVSVTTLPPEQGNRNRTMFGCRWIARRVSSC